MSSATYILPAETVVATAVPETTTAPVDTAVAVTFVPAASVYLKVPTVALFEATNPPLT